jgi:hypothetical protein
LLVWGRSIAAADNKDHVFVLQERKGSNEGIQPLSGKFVRNKNGSDKIRGNPESLPHFRTVLLPLFRTKLYNVDTVRYHPDIILWNIVVSHQLAFDNGGSRNNPLVLALEVIFVFKDKPHPISNAIVPVPPDTLRYVLLRSIHSRPMATLSSNDITANDIAV